MAHQHRINSLLARISKLESELDSAFSELRILESSAPPSRDIERAEAIIDNYIQRMKVHKDTSGHPQHSGDYYNVAKIWDPNNRKSIFRMIINDRTSPSSLNPTSEEKMALDLLGYKFKTSNEGGYGDE